MTFEHQAACPFCGQMIFVSTANAQETQEKLQLEAMEKCDCAEAIMRRGMTATEAAIQGVLGEGGCERFDNIIPEGTIEAIRTICKSILNEQINAVTLTAPTGDVIKLVKNGHSVKIRRTAKQQMEM